MKAIVKKLVKELFLHHGHPICEKGEQMRKRLRRANISAHLEVRDKPTARAVSLVTHGNLLALSLSYY